MATTTAPGVAKLFTPPPDFPGLSNHLVTDAFWATFPQLWIAIPFGSRAGIPVHGWATSR